MRLQSVLAAAAATLALGQGALPALGQIPGKCVSTPAECARAEGGGNTGGGNTGGATAPTVDAADAAFRRGNAALNAGNLSAAEAAFAEALRHNANHGGVWNNLGIVYSRQGRTDDALGAYAKAIALGVQNARENYESLAVWKRGKEAMVEANKTTARREVKTGIDLLRAGRYDEARARFKTALNYDPTNADARAAAGYIAALKRNRPLQEDPRRRAQEEARRRATAGDPAWITEIVGKAARKLGGQGISAGGMAWAEAFWGEKALIGAKNDPNDDLASGLGSSFWDRERGRRPTAVEIALPGLIGTEVGQQPAPVEGSAPPPASNAPDGKKADPGKTLTAADLAALETRHGNAIRTAAKAEPARQEAARAAVREIEVQMVTSAPTAPRRPRFPEPPPPATARPSP